MNVIFSLKKDFNTGTITNRSRETKTKTHTRYHFRFILKELISTQTPKGPHNLIPITTSDTISTRPLTLRSTRIEVQSHRHHHLIRVDRKKGPHRIRLWTVKVSSIKNPETHRKSPPLISSPHAPFTRPRVRIPFSHTILTTVIVSTTLREDPGFVTHGNTTITNLTRHNRLEVRSTTTNVHPRSTPPSPFLKNRLESMDPPHESTGSTI